MRAPFIVLTIFSGCGEEKKRPSPIVPYLDCQQFELGKSSIDATNYTPKQKGVCSQTSPAFPDERTVRVFFIRHAESTWGFTSNIQQGLGSPPKEQTDAHLSDDGLAGALQLRDWIFDKDRPTEDQRFLAGNPVPEDSARRVVFATSNLRRAVLTALIGFQDRLVGGAKDRLQIDNIHIVRSMAELTTNADSIPLTPPGKIPYLTFKDECPFKLKDMRDIFLTQCSVDDEPDISDFCTWVRNQVQEDQPTAETGKLASKAKGITDFVLVGHSIWIRKLFAEFLLDSDVKNKTERKLRSSNKKFPNQGVLKFLLRLPPNGDCEIVPSSAEMVFGKIEGRYPGSGVVDLLNPMMWMSSR
jgi:hypothetical protein